ncbi:MAG TPA: alpha/beta hydrolase [Steroidobacteraceae bacterium]|nr:alpha/beta hydrolase [Steroidobacteraceae bacterium]
MITQTRLAWLTVLLLTSVAARADDQAVARAAAPPNKITVGSLTLKYCNADYDGYCGRLKRPLDPTGAIKGTITIGFEYYPRFDQSTPARGTLLPQEGGPGYSSTGTRDAYLNIFGPLREHRDVLIVDKRGTGTSGAIDCREIQTGDPSDPAALKACADRLGAKAYLFGTHLAVDDIAAVLDALQIDEVDFYGDSYGTYVGQTFAAWYPQRLRSLILDSAYPARPTDVWFPTDWATGRDGLDLVCERSPSCRALSGKATARIERLLREVRRQPISGTAPDADGIPLAVTVDVSMLFLLMTNLGNSPITYRDLDAAARAWLDHRDSLPLLRLAAEYSTPFVSNAVDFSYGQYQAVICQEYPLHYDLDDSPAQRRRQYARGIEDARQNRPELFAPFSIDEALASNANFTPLATCLDWPKPLPAYPQGDPLPAKPKFPDVPTLVLSGDLDSVTSPQDAAQAAAQFPNVTHLLIPNLTHVTAYFYSDIGYLPDGGDTTHCVQRILRRFVAQLSPGDTSCIPNVRPIRTVPKFAASVEQLDPAQAATGNKASMRELQLAAATLETVGDVFSRFLVTFGIGSGLRGGEFTYALEPFGYEFELRRVQWTDDLQVTGRMRWHLATGNVIAVVNLLRDGKQLGSLTIQWNDVQKNAIASLNGTIGNKAVKARRIAP